MDDETEDDAPVIVGDVDLAPDDVTNEGDTTVIVETPPAEDDDAVDAVVIATELDVVQRLTALETRMSAVEAQAAVASIDAEIALDIANDAIDASEEIVEATDDAIVETIEGAEIEDTDNDGDDEIVVDEIAPVSSRIHPLFRSFKDWKAGR